MQFDIAAWDGKPFDGAKLALYLGARLAVLLRDDKPGLAFPDHWDLPGGGREGGESPLECALRECREELGLTVPQAAVIWGRAFNEGEQVKWFFVARMAEEAIQEVVFGDEGQRWVMMQERDFLDHAKAVPAFQTRLAIWMSDRESFL